MSARILVADDDPDIVGILSDALGDEGYEVCRASNGVQVLQQMEQKPIDLFILDVMMPELDGLETLRRIRRQTDAPVLILSARGRDIDKVVGLQIGADDYVAKPFSLDVLIARVGAHLRRENRHRQAEAKLTSGAILLDTVNRSVSVKGEPIALSAKEFQILYFLVRNAGQAVSREQIYEAVWQNAFGGDLNTVTVHIRNLRAKLGAEGARIQTVWGVGYRLACVKP